MNRGWESYPAFNECDIEPTRASLKKPEGPGSKGRDYD
jgi:hypothetical protein